jgi:hypothetical protein
VSLPRADHHVEALIGERQLQTVGDEDMAVLLRILLRKVVAPTACGYYIALTQVHRHDMIGDPEPIGGEGVTPFAATEIENPVVRLKSQTIEADGLHD